MHIIPVLTVEQDVSPVSRAQLVPIWLSTLCLNTWLMYFNRKSRT